MMGCVVYGYDPSSFGMTWFFEGEKRRALPLLVKLSYVEEGKKRALIFGTQTNSTAKLAYDEFYGQ